MPGSSTSYRVTAVYYIDTSDVVMRSKLIKIRQSSTNVIILHHYDLDEVLRIFIMVYIERILAHKIYMIFIIPMQAVEERLDIFPFTWILLGRATEMVYLHRYTIKMGI